MKPLVPVREIAPSLHQSVPFIYARVIFSDTTFRCGRANLIFRDLADEIAFSAWDTEISSIYDASKVSDIDTARDLSTTRLHVTDKIGRESSLSPVEEKRPSFEIFPLSRESFRERFSACYIFLSYGDCWRRQKKTSFSTTNVSWNCGLFRSEV